MKVHSQYHNYCLLCKSEKLIDQENYAKTYLTKCAECGFVFSKRVPSHQELEQHYDGYGRNDYLSPITIKRYNEILDQFEPYRKNNRLLDVGCGIGYFLDVAKERGWEVYGTEYTDEAVNICQQNGIHMTKGMLMDDTFDENMFDIITSFEVIEHINNPEEDTNLIHRFLRKGGLFYLTTPNFNSFSRRYLKENYNVITYPEHLSYYTPKTLTGLMNNLGFKKVKLRTTGISITRIKKSLGVSDQPLISEVSDDEKLRNMMESGYTMKMLKELINTGLTTLYLGDTIKGYFAKT